MNSDRIEKPDAWDMPGDLFAGQDAADDARLEAAGYRYQAHRALDGTSTVAGGWYVSPEGLILTRAQALRRLDALGRPVDGGQLTQEGE